MKKTLHLTLKKKWFDLILKGEKIEEYRIAKPYWLNRLTHDYNQRDNAFFFRHFDEIIFRNGYASNAPLIRIECQGIGYRVWQKSVDERLAPTILEPLFVLYLGKIIETKHIKSAPKTKSGNTADNSASAK